MYNEKYVDMYLIKPAADGSREDTKLAVEYSDEAVDELLKQGYVLVCDADFQKLIGNADKPYSIAMDGTLYETPPYVPPLEEVQAAKLAEIDMWTADKITGGFTSSCSGEPIQYDSDEATQSTMQTMYAATKSLDFTTHPDYQGVIPVRGYADGSAIKTVFYLTAPQVQTFMDDLALHIGKCKQAGWEKQALVEAALSKEDLDAIILD